jgi:hypothetical protein
MANGIGRYYGTVDERIERASDMLGFFDAIARIHIQSHCSDGDLQELALLWADAAIELHDLGVPVPRESR